jgi:hypothetical protein
MEAISPSAEVLPRVRARLLVAPASVYEELPEFGGDGRLIRSIAGHLGMETGVIPTPGLGRVTDGAILVRAAIERAEADGIPLLIVSLSKGGSDVRLALEQIGHAPPALAGWVNVCGLIRGSHLFSQMSTPTTLRGRMLLKQLSLIGMPRRSFEDLAASDVSPLHAPLRIPHGVRTISVVALPFSHQPTSALRSRHARLARYGPNDGSVLALDAIAPNSLVYPARDTDHYFGAQSVPTLMYRLLTWIANAGWLTDTPGVSHGITTPSL